MQNFLNKWMCQLLAYLGKYTVVCVESEGGVKGRLYICATQDDNEPFDITGEKLFLALDGEFENITADGLPDGVTLCENDITLLETWCTRTDTIEIENHEVGSPGPSGPGAVPWPVDSQRWQFTMSDGSIRFHDYVGWDGSQQTPTIANQWAYINTMLSRCLSAVTGKPVRAQANGRQYGQRGDDGLDHTPWGAYGWVDCCPGDLSVVAVKSTTVGGKRDGRIVHLMRYLDVGDVEMFTRCITKGKPDVWTNEAGETVPKPDRCLFKDCQFPAMPEVPEAASCTTTTLGPLCAFNAADEEVATGIFLDFEDCDGARTVIPYTYPDGVSGDRELFDDDGLTIKNCDGTEIEEPPPAPCETATVVMCEDGRCAQLTLGKNDDRRDSALGICNCAIQPGTSMSTLGYTNSDNTTDVSNGIGDVDADGDNDDVKFSIQFGEPDVQPVLEFTNQCLAEGGTMEWRWTTVPVTAGAPSLTGSATFDSSNYAQQDTATGANVQIFDTAVGDGGKLATLTAVCTKAGEGADQTCVKTHDPCVEAAVQALCAKVDTLNNKIARQGQVVPYCRTVDGTPQAWLMQLDCDGAILWDRRITDVNPDADPLS